MPHTPFVTNTRVMTERDVASGVRLNTLAGWNQTEADWRMFLESSPDGCFVTEVQGQVVGTAATICYENRFAWIGMVLVDPEHRNSGIGTRLLHKTIEYLDGAGIAAMKLDATALGKPIYSKLGFVPEYEIERWVREKSAAASPQPEPRSVSPDKTELERMCDFDRELFGADRGFLIRALHDHAPELTNIAWKEGVPQGYTLGRKGRFADHLGPCVANEPNTAQHLLRSFLQQSSRERIIVDCLPSNSVFLNELRLAGFVFSRPLTRMVRGPNSHPGRPESICAILGPEFG